MSLKLTFYAGAAALLGGCQHHPADPSPTPQLLGTRWALVQVATTPVAVSSYSEDYNSFIRFAAAGSQVSGQAACAALRGQFVLSSGGQQLAINQLTTAAGSCASSNVADRYLAALPQTSRYVISHDTLRLYTPQSPQAQLVFRAAP